ncbi:uncharacterized protein ACIQIH_002042, partial [Cyanocitta cristata]
MTPRCPRGPWGPSCGSGCTRSRCCPSSPTAGSAPPSPSPGPTLATAATAATRTGRWATFPCHRWLDSGHLELREGTARTPREAAREPQLLRQRQEERRERKEAFQWAPYAPGWPWCLRALPPSLCPWPPPPASPAMTSPPPEPLAMTSPAPMTSPGPAPELSPTLSFPLAHRAQIAARAGAAQIRIRLRGLRSGGSWSSFGDVREALEGPGTPISGGCPSPPGGTSGGHGGTP